MYQVWKILQIRVRCMNSFAATGLEDVLKFLISILSYDRTLVWRKENKWSPLDKTKHHSSFSRNFFLHFIFPFLSPNIKRAAHNKFGPQ